MGGFLWVFFSSLTALIQSAHCHQRWEVSVLLSVGYIDEVSDAFTLSITSIGSCPSFSDNQRKGLVEMTGRPGDGVQEFLRS